MNKTLAFLVSFTTITLAIYGFTIFAQDSELNSFDIRNAKSVRFRQAMDNNIVLTRDQEQNYSAFDVSLQTLSQKGALHDLQIFQLIENNDGSQLIVSTSYLDNYINSDMAILYGYFGQLSFDAYIVNGWKFVPVPNTEYFYIQNSLSDVGFTTGKGFICGDSQKGENSDSSCQWEIEYL